MSIVKYILFFLLLINSLAIAKECAEPNYDNEFIAQFYFKGDKLTNGLMVYQNKNGNILYPVVELFQLLDLKFEYSNNIFRSNVFAKKNMLFIDYKSDEIDINSTKYIKNSFENLISNEKVICYEDEYYVEDTILEKLLDTKFEFSKSFLRIKATSDRIYPIDIKKIKYQLENNKRIGKEDKNLTWFEKLKFRYKNDDIAEKVIDDDIFSLDMLSFKLNTNSNKNSTNMTIATNARFLDHDIDLLLTKRIKNKLKYNTKIKKTFLNEKIQPYVYQYTIGDVGLSSKKNVVKSYGGKGIIVTNKQANVTISRYIDLTGVLPSDWFVELHINNKIEAFQESNDDNKYTFNNIELRSGKNTIKYIFYGPLGEIEEKEEYYYVNDTYKNYGVSWYNMEYIHDDEENNFDAFHFDFTYGLSKYLTSTIQFWDIKNYNYDENNTKIIKDNKIVSPEFKLRPFVWLKLDMQFPFYTDNTSINAKMFDINLNPFSFIPNLNFKINQYSENYKGVGSKVLPDDTLALKTNIPIPYTSKSIEFERIYTKEQTKTTINDKYKLSANIRKDIKSTIKLDRDLDRDINNFDLIISKNNKKRSDAITLNYKDTNKESIFTRISYNNTYIINHNYKLISGANYSNISKKYSLSTGVSYLNKSYTLNSKFKRNTNGEYFAGFSFETKFLNYGKSIYDIQMIKDASLRKGILIVDAFLIDSKKNIIQKIEKATVIINGKNYGLDDELYKRTDENATIIPNLNTYKKFVVEFAEDSLPDISWKVISKPKSIVFKPGKTQRITFYATPTGEVDGIVSYDDTNHTTPLGGINIKLKNIFYETIDTVKTEPDGYYIFQKVPLGEYFIEINKISKKKLNIRETIQDELLITDDKLFYFDHDIVFSK